MASQISLKSTGFDPRLQPRNEEHVEFIKRFDELDRHYLASSQNVLCKMPDWWDQFLAIQKDTRDPIDENWRSNVFVPLPFTTTRTKAAQTTELLGNVEPVWQVEATREDSAWYEESKHIERLLDYSARNNSWRKFIYKQATARSVQGTSMFKVVWTRRAHKVNLFSSQLEEQRLLDAIIQAEQNGAPKAPDYRLEPEAFESWRNLVNQAGTKGRIPAPPRNGPYEVLEYEGPALQYLPIWTVHVDPLIDEMVNQHCVIHRMVKPLSWVLDRADDDPASDKPYILQNVMEAKHQVGEPLMEDEEQRLAEAMGLLPAKETSPYYKDAVILHEVWSKDNTYQYAVVMNRKWVINKRPFEYPLLTSSPNIFALRNVIVPGHFYGLSDYQESERLFTELNTFRRLRMDGATLNTLPVFVKQAGYSLTEALRKIRPGMVITLPTINAIKALIDHKLPPEAYREPAEIKLEIEDATEVYSSTKGAPATVGRVTGTEFQGRAGQTLLKYKVDAALIEDEMAGLPHVMLSLFAQMGGEQIRREIGGDPDALVDVTRDQLIHALNYRFRFRGATKNIQPDLQVQQLTTAVREFGQDLTPMERRLALQTILELMDIRGSGRIISPEGSMMIQAQAQLMQQQAAAQAQLGTQQAQAGAVGVPGQMSPEVAGAISGGESGK